MCGTWWVSRPSSTVQDLVDSDAVHEVHSHRLTVPPLGGLVTCWLSRAQRRDLPTFWACSPRMTLLVSVGPGSALSLRRVRPRD
jgi:hypothetical protein